MCLCKFPAPCIINAIIQSTNRDFNQLQSQPLLPTLSHTLSTTILGEPDIYPTLALSQLAFCFSEGGLGTRRK